MAERTGLEPATPCVTGRYSNQLNYRSTDSFTAVSNWLMAVCSCYFPCQGKRNEFDAWQFPTLAWGDPTLPSALRRFTSEFGMGSGGTTALKPPGKSWCTKRIFYAMTALPSLGHTGHILQYAPADVLALRLVTPQNLSFPLIFIRYRLKIVSLKKRLWRCKVKPHGSLVPVSSTHRCAYTPGLSTS